MKLRALVLTSILLFGTALGAGYWWLTTTPPQPQFVTEEKVDGLFGELKQLHGDIDSLKIRIAALEQKLKEESAAVKIDTKPKTETETEEEKTRRLLLGVWHDNYRGKRMLTLNADGTGTMHIELGGAEAFLFGSKMRFDMKWKLEGKKLTKTNTGGEPTDKVNLILNTMGTVAVDTLLELTEDRLNLQDKDGKTKYDWRRPTKEEPK